MTEKMKRCVKNILLIMALIPYGVFLVLGVTNYLRTAEYKYLYALIEPLMDFWIDSIAHMDPRSLGMLLFSVGYPVFYLLDRSARKTPAEPETELPASLAQTKPKKTVSVSYGIYLFCFLPYLLLLRASIFGVDFGFFGNSSTYYGWEAVFIQGLGLCVIPILPIAVLYQVIFLILTGKRLSPRQKKISLVLFLSIGGALVLSCVIVHAATIFGR